MFVAVILFALAAWGAYAWRYASQPNQTPPEPQSTLAVQSPGAAGDSTQTKTPLDPGSVPGFLPENVSGGTWANRPMALPQESQAGKLAVDSEPGNASMRQALEAQRQGDLITARRAMTRAIEQGLSTEDADAARRELARLADAMLFSRATNVNDPLIALHVVEPGQSVHSIAAARRVSESLLARINQMAQPNMLRIGDRLKVINGPFWGRVSKSDHRMDVLLGDAIVRSYRVGLGAEGGTPTGAWMVRDKLKDPDWTDPNTSRHYDSADPENPIGERWIALEGIEGEAVGKSGFGIHGTIDPTSIGQDMSMGCVRMLADDVDFVFDLLVIKDSRVIIRP